jgi:hypothetical protein
VRKGRNRHWWVSFDPVLPLIMHGCGSRIVHSSRPWGRGKKKEKRERYKVKLGKREEAVPNQEPRG